MAQRHPFPTICIALGFTQPEALLRHARQEIESGERFLEIRLDYLTAPEQGLKVVRTLLQESPDCTILATCRRHQNGGRFNGGVEEQLCLLDAAVAAGARAVDVEIETAELAINALDALRSKSRMVISYHNYAGTPALDPVVRRLTRVPADAYKLVATARKPTDNMRVLTLARAHARVPLILLSMGETGFPTRVLSTLWGGLFTYAAPVAAEGTAAGQVCARALRQLYRFEKISRNAKIYGVIADPVRHSISPAVHNRAFQAKRMDAVYLPFLVHPPQLKDFFSLAGKLPIAGFSVTIPHKQKVLRYLDIVDPLARRIGAVNTVWRKAGKWRGTNTDVAGVIVPLSRHMRLAKATVLLAGNGGAARGAAFALTDAGARLAIVGRNADRVRALSKACDAEPLSMEEACARHFDALVHATPVGMFPKVDECIFPDLIPAEVVFDMVYNPLDTLLLRRAREQGKTVVTGMTMFLEQAVHQFETWTGESAPRSVMERAGIEALGHCASGGNSK